MMDNVRQIKWALGMFEAGERALDAVEEWTYETAFRMEWAERLSDRGYAIIDYLAPRATALWRNLSHDDPRAWDLDGLRKCLQATGYLPSKASSARP